MYSFLMQLMILKHSPIMKAINIFFSLIVTLKYYSKLTDKSLANNSLGIVYFYDSLSKLK